MASVLPGCTRKRGGAGAVGFLRNFQCISHLHSHVFSTGTLLRVVASFLCACSTLCECQQPASEFQMQILQNVLARSFTIARMALVVTVVFLFVPVTSADEIITLNPRENVTQSAQLWTPYAAQPKAVALLIPGGPGNIALQETSGGVEATRPHLFLTWRDALLQAGFAVAVVDAPSDQKDMTQEFRMSAAHSTDMQAVARELQQRFPAAKLMVIAHSRGTISAGYLARQLDGQISAMVLLSGLYQATLPGPEMPSSGPGLSQVDLPALKTPILLVHHNNDACPVAPIDAATKLGARLPLLSIDGVTEPVSDVPCGPGTPHWFFGKEKEVSQKVVAWLSGKT